MNKLLSFAILFLKVLYMENPGLQNIKKMYEKLTYFDQYGGSVILVIFITFLLCLFISYCFIMIQAQPIIDDWPNQRCKPNIIPFAGFITHPEGMSASDYTYQNFTYCTQNILSNITGIAIEPLTFVVSSLNNMANQLNIDVQNVRGMFDKIRTMFQSVSEEIMGRLINVTIPLQQIIISIKDVIGKMQGTMTAGLFTLLGSYYTLKSLMGAIAQFIITILISLAAMIAVFWILPFTWGAAIANTSIFVAIAVPMSIILAFMSEILHVKTSLSIPSIKCFDENTLILMNNGSQKKIVDIQVGDLLCENNAVSAVFKVQTTGSTMYNLDNILVSDSHMVKYMDHWIRVSEHPHATKCVHYAKPYLYCLNTFNKTIKINNCVFSDWDEHICQDTYLEMATNWECGFNKDVLIKLVDGTNKKISDIVVGDILSQREKVYGLVKIHSGINNLGSNILYHLLTDTQNFYLNGIQIPDYNADIDAFLEKQKNILEIVF